MAYQYSLVDANYLAHRSVYKGSHLQTSQGIPTGGIFIFLKSLWYLRELGNEMILVFDGGHSPYRKVLYLEYKVRDEKELKIQKILKFTFDTLMDITPKLGFPTLRMEQTEADDVLYLLAKHMRTWGIIALSGDDDFLQLTKLDIDVYNPRTDEHWNREKFTKEWGFAPEYFSLWKSLVGDDSDKILGVPRLGMGKKFPELGDKWKAAPYIIKQLKEPSLSGLYDWAVANPDPLGNKIINHFQIVKRNYLLMDLDHCEVSLDSVLEELKISTQKAEKNLGYITKIFKDLEFKELAMWLTYLS
jgi:5'-3' exonuclease